ncbi:MAG: hypothetical protein RBR26_06755 [Methanosarcina mazei]|nr:hypothetical protein [Methanosarcina mazei]
MSMISPAVTNDSRDMKAQLLIHNERIRIPIALYSIACAMSSTLNRTNAAIKHIVIGYAHNMMFNCNPERLTNANANNTANMMKATTRMGEFLISLHFFQINTFIQSPSMNFSLLTVKLFIK